MGYQSVEFFSTYLDWTLEYAREVRGHLDALNLACSSTHNGMRGFTAAAVPKTAALNQILGSPFAILASVPKIEDLDGWKRATEAFADVADRLRPHGLAAGFHNHQREWTPIEGTLPIDVVAGGTPPDFVMQVDVAPAVEFGTDLPAWIRRWPGRVRSIHCRDWSATRGSNLAVGDGDGPWAEIFSAAEATSQVADYLVENGHCTPEEEFPVALRSLTQLRAVLDRTD
jgi:sugar phosphate isomerase/epimerase